MAKRTRTRPPKPPKPGDAPRPRKPHAPKSQRRPSRKATPPRPLDLQHSLESLFARVIANATAGLFGLSDDQGSATSGRLGMGHGMGGPGGASGPSGSHGNPHSGVGVGPMVQAQPIKEPHPVRFMEWCNNLAALGLANQYPANEGPAQLIELERVVLVAKAEDGVTYQFTMALTPAWRNPWAGPNRGGREPSDES